MRLTKCRGVDTIIRNIRKHQKVTKAAVMVALLRAGLKLQRASQKIVPVQFENLKASAFTRLTSRGDSVIVGYTAAYAVYVHENLDAAHGEAFNKKHAKEIANAHTPAQKKIWFRRGKNQQAKFLERPWKEMRLQLFNDLRHDIAQAYKGGGKS